MPPVPLWAPFVNIVNNWVKPRDAQAKCFVGIRLTEAQHAYVHKQAQHLGISSGEVLRRMIDREIAAEQRAAAERAPPPGSIVIRLRRASLSALVQIVVLTTARAPRQRGPRSPA